MEPVLRWIAVGGQVFLIAGEVCGLYAESFYVEGNTIDIEQEGKSVIGQQAIILKDAFRIKMPNVMTTFEVNDLPWTR